MMNEGEKPHRKIAAREFLDCSSSSVKKTCRKVCMCAKLFQSGLTLCNLMDLWPAHFFCLWDSPGKSSGLGCHALFQAIFPTQGSNPRLLSAALAGEIFTTSECMVVKHASP